MTAEDNLNTLTVDRKERIRRTKHTGVVLLVPLFGNNSKTEWNKKVSRQNFSYAWPINIVGNRVFITFTYHPSDGMNGDLY